METKEITTQVLPKDFITNDTLPNLWIDNLTVFTRGDGISLVNFYTRLPTGMVEQTRIMAKKETLKTLVDAICENLNYCPTPKTKKKTSKK